MRKLMIGLLLLSACGGSGGGSNSETNIHDCDVENPDAVASEENSETKELTVICGNGQVGDNQDNDTNEAAE